MIKVNVTQRAAREIGRETEPRIRGKVSKHEPTKRRCGKEPIKEWESLAMYIR
jgi:hypothetical protein